MKENTLHFLVNNEQQEKAETINSTSNKVSEDIAEVMTTDISETIDVEKLINWHPVFTKHQFSEKDIAFFNDVKTQLLENSSLSTLQTIVKDISDSRTDLAEGVLFLYGRIH